MDLSLTPEQEQLRDLAREWVDREVVPHAAAWDRDEQVDRALPRKLGEVGFLGLGIDEEYGGSGGDFLSYCLVMEELGRGCLEASVGYATQRTQFGKPIAAFRLVQEMLADIAVETDAARLLVWRAADLVDPARSRNCSSAGR